MRNVFIDYSLPGGTKITGKLLHIKMKYILNFSISKHLKKIGYESYWHLKIVACAKKSSNFAFSSRGKLTQVTLSCASDGFFEPNGGCATLNLTTLA